MMYPAIFSNVITGRDPEETATRTRELGLTAVQFVPAEVSVGFGFDSDDPTVIRDFTRWKRAYDAAGVDIVGVAGYLNLLHSAPEIRQRNIDTFGSYLRRMRDELGTELISTETGSLAASGDWDDDPANRTPQAWSELRGIVTDLVGIAEQSGVIVLLEPYIVNVCWTPELGVQFVQEIGSKNLGICMDPTNFFSNDLATQELVDETIRRGFAAEAPYFKLAHAKDVTPPAPGDAKPGLPGPGQGILNYPLYLDLLAEAGYDGPLVIEHLTEAEVPEALRFVQGQIADHSARIA